MVPGNHDVPPLYRPLSRLLRPLARFDRYVSTDREPLFVDDEIAVMGLGTARGLAGKNGRVSVAQMTAIRRVLGGLPDRLFKVLVTHHPLAVPRPGHAAGAGRSGAAALEAAADAGVHLLLSGHYHRAGGEAPAHVARERSLLVVHAGTAVSTRTRGGEANSYNLIRLDGERLSIAVMAWRPRAGFTEVATGGLRARRAAGAPRRRRDGCGGKFARS